MKKATFLLIFSLAAQISFSQVVVLNYMKVPPGGGAAYEEAEQYAQKVMQERVNRGEMIDWELYRIHNRGTESDYHYVTVDVYENMAASLKGISQEAIDAALGNKADQVVDQIMSSRDLIYRETLGRADGITTEGEDEFLMISFMKAKHPPKYFEMESTAYKPLHQIAVDNGEMAGWSVWVPMLFDQKHTDYTALTVNGYSSLEQMGMTNYGKWYEEYIPGKSDDEIDAMNTFFDETNNIRTIVQAQIWQKLLSTTPSDE